jgi:hypothetical protein
VERNNVSLGQHNKLERSCSATFSRKKYATDKLSGLFCGGISDLEKKSYGVVASQI